MHSILRIQKGKIPAELALFNFHFSVTLFIFGIIMTAIYLMYVLIEPSPRWLLLLAGIMAILGGDGVLRNNWPEIFKNRNNLIETTPYLFLPSIIALAIPLLIEHNFKGYYAILMAVAGGIFFTTIIGASSISVDKKAPNYYLARIFSTFGVYFTGFTFFSLTYLLNLELGQIIVTTGLVSFMLGMEIFRERQINHWETLLLSLTTGIILAEFRWVSHYMAFGSYAAGLMLLLVFFVIIGLLLNHQIGTLGRRIIIQYTLTALSGLVIIILAQNLDLI